MKAIKLVIFMALLLSRSMGKSDEIGLFIERLNVGKPICFENLMIYPLMDRSTKHLDLVTLDEAMDRNWLQIREIGSGEVNHVELRNRGPSMVFIMTGEILSGAKQDRMLGQDLLVPAKSGWLRVPVYCVEHGRWVGTSATFKTAREVAPGALRQRARITEDQTAVWDAIAASQEKLGIASGTSTVRANYEDEAVKEDLAGYAGRFDRLPRLDTNTVGVVVVTGDRIVCVDIFADNDLLARVWSKLLRSYALDAITGHEPAQGKAAIERFIKDLGKARYVSLGTPGAGALYQSETGSGRGSALLCHGRIVHFDFFTDDLADGGRPEWRLDTRREQRLDD